MNILRNRYFLISSFILFLYTLPWIIFGENSYVLIHDNLDDHEALYKTLIESGKIFSYSSDKISSFMDAPRGSFTSEFNFILWLYYFFNPYTASVINQFLIRIIAFIGMYLLLDRYVLPNEERYSFFIALLYSILPFYPSAGLSDPGLPLITYVFLNIRNNLDTKKDWIILILLPFYSSFVLCMMFYIVFVGIVWLYDIYNKIVTKKFTIALFLFGIIYLIVNYRLLEVFIFHSTFVSHRVEFKPEYYNFITALKVSFINFILGQYHAPSLHIVFLPFVGIVFLWNLFSKSKDKLLIGLFLLNILISLWFGFWKYNGWESIREHISILHQLNLERFNWLSPLLWYILFALSIKYIIIYYKEKYIMYMINIIIVLSILLSFYKSDFVSEYKNHNISYKQFFAKDLFNKIDKFILKKKNTYKVVSIGIYPSIARYNGFYTADGYINSYSLEYKHKFRDIILPEFKHEWIRQSFDDWGSRCYVFVDDVGYNYVRKKDQVYPINIDINSTALLNLGVNYIFSSYKIMNANKNKIKLLKKFEDENSAWDIYLYEVY